MTSNKYLIVIYTVTAGQHYEDLGSDEQEIVLFAWLVLDIINQKIIDVKCNYVKPKYCEKLSETAKNDFQLTEQLIEENGQYLENVLEEFNSYVRTKLNYDNGEQFTFITDGQQYLRQVLHPECTNKNINLPEYFYRFFDLKKEFRKFLRDNMTESGSNTSNSNLSNELLERSSTSSIDYQMNDTFSNTNYQQTLLTSSTSSSEFDQMVGDAQTKINSIFPNLLAPTIIQKFSIHQMLKELSLRADSSAEIVVQTIKNMANIILNLISNGHVFDEEETVNSRFEPGICSRNEIVDNMTVVRARGLPWQSSDQDVARFFKGLNISKGGVALCLSQLGRRNGEALIRFTCVEHRELALKRHKHHIKHHMAQQRWIEVYRAKGEDFINIAGGSNNEAQKFLQKGAQVIIRMRGLPFSTMASEVVDFFASHQNNCSTEVVAKKVDSSLDSLQQNDHNNNRTSTPNGEQQTTCIEDKNDLNNNVKSGEEKSGDAVEQMRKPYCQVMHGVEGVLFVRRKDNRASGDAFCLFDEEQGKLALTKNKQFIGTRWIELFRSSTAEVQQVFNRTMDNSIKNGFEQNQISNSKSTVQSYQNTTSFLPIHQPNNSIYQATTTNHATIVNPSQQHTNLPAASLQPPPTLHQTTAILGHHLHPNSLGNYSGHSSFHQPIHHQLTNHANSPTNVGHYANQCFNSNVKQHNNNLMATNTCPMTKLHSVCTVQRPVYHRSTV